MPEPSPNTSEEAAALAAGWQALRGAPIPAAFKMLSDLAGSLDTPPEEVAKRILSLPPADTEKLRAFLQLCAACADSAHDISRELSSMISHQQWEGIDAIKISREQSFASPWPEREPKPIAMSSMRIVAKLTDLEAEARKKHVTLDEACKILVAQGNGKDALWADHERQSKTREQIAKIFDGGRFCRIDSFTAEFVRGAELVVALGGDGNFATAAHPLTGRTAITGVNIDPETSRGAILQYASTDEFLNNLGELARGNFRYEPWARLSAKRNGQPIQEATCELYLGSSSPYRMSWSEHQHLSAGEQPSANLITSSSGLLISLGSGLFLQNAARYVFPKGFNFPIDAPYARYVFREIDRCEVELKDGSSQTLDPLNAAWGELLPGETLVVKSLTRGSGVLTVDSRLEYDFSNGTVVEVSLSPAPLWTLRPL